MGTCEGGGMCVWKESGLETQSRQQEKQRVALCNSSAPGPWQEGAGREGGGDRRRERTVGTQSWMGPVLWRLQPPRPPRGQVRHAPPPVLRARPSPTFLMLPPNLSRTPEVHISLLPWLYPLLLDALAWLPGLTLPGAFPPSTAPSNLLFKPSLHRF